MRHYKSRLRQGGQQPALVVRHRQATDALLDEQAVTDALGRREDGISVCNDSLPTRLLCSSTTGKGVTITAPPYPTHDANVHCRQSCQIPHNALGSRVYPEL